MSSAEMIVSVHLAHVGLRDSAAALRRPPDPGRVAGLQWAAAAPLAIGHVPPHPLPGRIGLIAAWTDDASLDAFLRNDPWSDRLAHGYEVRLEPLRASGSWSALPGLAAVHESGALDEPVGVLTLGRLRLSQAPRFFRATAQAERPLLRQPGLLASVGLARPPFIATFSLWKTIAAMREYAYGADGGHARAIVKQNAKPFHYESIFVRLRPYRSTGTWEGAEPLAGLAHSRSRPQTDQE